MKQMKMDWVPYIPFEKRYHEFHVAYIKHLSGWFKSLIREMSRQLLITFVFVLLAEKNKLIG